MKRHPFSPQVGFSNVALRRALSARLGRRVELLTSAPTDDDPDGVLIVEDPDTGEHVDVDPVVVAEVVAQVVAATPPARPLDERTADLIRAARNIDDLRDVLLGYFGERVERVAVERQRAQAARQWLDDQRRREQNP